MKASVIVPTLNRFSVTIETLAQLLNQQYSDYEIIVVDQNTIWPAEVLSSIAAVREDPKVRWIKLKSIGVVSARQYAASVARGDVFIFVDDDVILNGADFIAKHMINYGDPTIGAVCGREVVSKTGDRRALAVGPSKWIDVDEHDCAIQPLIFPRNSKVRQDVCTFCTCNASVRRVAFMSVGGFDENFAGASYGDDYDFAIRLHEGGHRIVFDPSPELVHLQFQSGGLRLSASTARFSEFDKALSGWIFLLRHGRPGWRGYLLYHWVLRRTIFLKRNIVHCWRIPAAAYAVWRAFWVARAAVVNGPRSRFGKNAES